MIFFITVLRALAACLITNSHYTGVYPTDLIANGGLFGNVIFFAVSGFCLVNIKESFPKWYAKRLVRLLPATWLMTAIYGIVGLFRIELTFKGLFSSFIFPSCYYFISSILVLYITCSSGSISRAASISSVMKALIDFSTISFTALPITLSSSFASLVK